MNINTLSRLLKELILVNDRVSLPGMGSFIAELAPSVFSDRALVIHPPFRRLMFRTSEIWNDELLEKLYAEQSKLDLNLAKEKIAAFLHDFKEELDTLKNVVIPHLGTMRATEQRDYYFVADKDLFIYPDAYGLEPINVKLLPKPGLVERLAYRESGREYAPLESLSKEKTPVSTGIKKTIVTFAVLIALIAIVVLMVVFKDEIRPVWEWILYSEQERELLKLL